MSPALRTAYGAVILALACALPFIGWFGLLPYAGLLGIGAFILSFFQRQHSERQDIQASGAAPQSDQAD
jgi:hypothetical protein